MGDNDSNFLYVSTSCSTYSAGEEVHGEVYLKIIEEIPSASIRIKIFGIECAEFTESDTLHYVSHKIFCKHELLAGWPSNLATKGDYICPFTFCLPSDLPTSTYIDLPEIKASITYKIEATISRTLKYTSEFQVKFSNSNKNNESRTLQRIPIKRCFCLTKKVAEIEISTNKPEYTCDDIVKVTMEGINDIMRSVNCRLFRVVKVLSSSGVCKVLRSEIISVETELKEIDINLSGLEGRIGRQNSSNGRFVQCGYWLSFEGRLKKLCRSEAQGIEIMLKINPKAMEIRSPRYSMHWEPKYIKRPVDKSSVDELISLNF